MVIYGCFMAVSMSKMDPKRPKFDIICTKIQSFYTICLFFPEAHLHHLFLNSFKKMVKKAKVFSIKLALPRHMSISVILEILQGRKRFQKTHQNLWMTYSRKVLQALKLNLIFLRSFKFNLSGSFQFGEFPLANFRILLLLLKLYSNTTFFFIKLL